MVILVKRNTGRTGTDWRTSQKCEVIFKASTVIKHHAMMWKPWQNCKHSRSLHQIEWLVRFMLWPLYNWVNHLQYTLCRRMGGSTAILDMGMRIITASDGYHARHFTDWAVTTCDKTTMITIQNKSWWSFWCSLIKKMEVTLIHMYEI